MFRKVFGLISATNSLALLLLVTPQYLHATIAACRGDGETDVTTCLQYFVNDAQRIGDGHVDLPRGTYSISNTLVIPNKVEIVGTNRGDANLTGSTIIASSKFPLGGVLVQMGTAPGPNFGVRLEKLTLNCNARASVGLQNLYSEEQSYGKDLLISNCGGAGLDVETGAAQNSGPFQDLEIYPGSGATVNAATRCVKIVDVIAFRGITGITCNAGSYYASRPDVAFQLDGGAFYQDMHVEHFTTAIALGSSVTAADGTTIVNSQFGPDVATGILIQSGPANQNIVLVASSCFGCSALLDDQMMDTVITDSSLGWYAIGNGATGGKSRMSSKYGLVSQIEGPFRAWNTAIGPGNAQNWGTVSIWDATPNGVTSVVQLNGAAQGSTNLYEWRDINSNLMANVSADGSFHTPSLQLTPMPAGRTCSSDTRGEQQFIATSTSAADHLQVCAQRDGGSFGWINIF